jgi:hypothetical protein
MKKNIFLIILTAITLIGFFFRFWNYSERFGIAYDQAHDAIVAREALRESKIPLVGPFSSAGPFQTSGTWYWLLMVPTAIYRDSVLSPWIFLTALYGFLIFGMGILGKKMEGDFFGFLLAGLTALSTAQIAQSVNLTNQTPIPLFSFLALVCAFWYLRKKTALSAFGMGLFSGFAASIHLQGMALGILVFITFLLGGRMKMRAFFFALLGAFLPMLPIVLWDTRNDFVNIQNMIYYYRFDQFNINLDVLGRRWLTYLTEFWPREWSHIVGGRPQIAILIAVLAVCFFMLRVIQRKMSKSWLLVFLSFGCMTVLIRYTRVPIFASFITFTHPFVILITAWVLYQAYRFKRIIGGALLLVVLVFTMEKTGNEVFLQPQNGFAKMSKEMRTMFTEKYPGETFAFYDWKYEEVEWTVPIALYMDEKNLLSDNGRRIGFLRRGPQDELLTPVISTSLGFIVDLSVSTSARLVEEGWIRINPFFIYKSTEEWRE